MNESPLLHWSEADKARSASWRSESGALPPKRVVVADDRMTADEAYKLACEGTAMLWRGDFQNARQLLQALARRIDHKPRRAKRKAPKPDPTPAEAFHLHRLAQSQRARLLGMLLLPFEGDHSVPLRRAPDVRQACAEAYGPGDAPYVASLRELLGLIGAHEWRKKGVGISALGCHIHPHYGVFSPVRGEYVDLVNKAPLPSRGPGLRHRHRNRRAGCRAGSPGRHAHRGHRSGPACAGVRTREHEAARPDRTGRNRADRPLPGRTGTAHCL